MHILNSEKVNTSIFSISSLFLYPGNCISSERVNIFISCLGSENETKEGEKQTRKRRHKSISPIVYDKDSSASESDSSGSEGNIPNFQCTELHLCTNQSFGTNPCADTVD